MQNDKIFLVAELSANHNQDKNLALKTIKAAKDSGADAIKLQTYTPDCMSIDCDLEDFRIKGTLWNGKKIHATVSAGNMSVPGRIKCCYFSWMSLR